MECRSSSFDKLPFTDLFRAYIQQSEHLIPFYETHPFDDNQVIRWAEQFETGIDRDAVVDVLSRFNRSFDPSEFSIRQIEKFRQKETLAVMTGQQLTLYGGPLFTIYKIITTLVYTRRWEKLLNRPVVPVFWLADEDHDFEEASRLGILDGETWKSLEMKKGTESGPVGRQELGSSFLAFQKELFSKLPESDFSVHFREEVSRFYKKGSTFRNAFGRWIMHLFADQGLVLAGSDDPGVKNLTSEVLLKAVQAKGELYKNLELQSTELERSGFERQAAVQPSNLFYLDGQHGRLKIEQNSEGWGTGHGTTWTEQELLKAIKDRPEQFSPNVFLRPLVQDRFLPTFAYVAGPGELAYFGQMKPLYRMLDLKMPILLPRFSITLMEPAIDRIFGELPFSFHEYSGRIEDLETEFLKRTGDKGAEALFTEWSKRAEALNREFRDQIEEIDPTLKASADKAGTLYLNELETLKGKVFRSLKERERIQLDRIRRIQENLFPDRQLQERQIAFIYYMNKYGMDIWQRLIGLLEEETPDTHKIVHL